MGLLALTTSFAAVGQVRYGVQGSAQGSTIVASTDLSSLGAMLGKLSIPVGGRVAFRAGIMADIPVSDRLSVRPQLLYSVKGGNADVGRFISDLLNRFGFPPTTLPAGDYTSRVAINYLELPLEVVYGLDLGPGRLLVGAGPYAALALGGTINGEAINFNTDGFRKADFGAIASLGYELPMGLVVSAYYSHGLTNISRNPTPSIGTINPTNPTVNLDPSAFGGTLQNRAYGLTVGYFIN